MTKAIASMGIGAHRALLALARRTFVPYAARHGYELHLHTNIVDPSRPVPWSKVPILRDLLARHEVVVWLDSDLMILDGREDIADALPKNRFLGLVEHQYKTGGMANTGVMVLRPEAMGFLDEVWAQHDLIHHRWWENAAICRLLGYDLESSCLKAPTPLFTDHTALLDPRWNSIPDSPSPRARIRHYPGSSLKKRAALMLRDLILRRAMLTIAKVVSQG